MCTVCGCAGDGREASDLHVHEHVGPDGRVYRHSHGDDHHHHHDHDDGGHAHDRHHHDDGHDHHHGDHHHGHDLHFGLGAAGTSVPGVTQAKLLRIEQDVLASNDALAEGNRARFAAARTFALNLVSSPGSGKTTLLARTLTDLAGRFPMAVIEGDQQTSLDADRIRATGAPALQINTGKGCHLDAQMIGRALDVLPPPEAGVLFIENVGNLVCPAGFALGEAHKVVVVSVTEGEDKPLKYPNMIAASDLMLVNKADLLPYLAFDLDRLIANARRVNPRIEVLTLSATTGAGLADWYAWIDAGRARVAGA